MKKTDKKQSKSRQEALNELTAGLEQSIKDFMDGDKYRAFLSKMSHLHNYSLNNQILIARQRPDATLCASYTCWKSLNRQVKKGESGIQIICPSSIKSQSLKDVRDENGRPVTLPDGSVKQEVVDRIIPFFKVGYLHSPSSGTVVKSENIKIGAIIETPALYPTLSAKGNLKYQLKICGCPSKEVKSKIAELLELVHLIDTRKLVMNYSLGMRQRLALAMALVGNPQFLILDEPLNGLDPEGIKDVRAIIAKLNEEYGVTIMISSHILSELQKVANHYGFLKNGVLIQEFSSSEIADTDLETFYFKNFL